MNLSRKRFLDYWLGRPLLAGLHVAARCLGAVLHRDHSAKPVRNALFVKFQGIGSLVISKPAIAAFRRSYPEAHCVYWGTPALEPLARQMPEFDSVLILDDSSALAAARSCLKALAQLWRMRIDWAFDLEVYSRLSSVLVTLTCARNRAGFAMEQIRSRQAHTHLVYFNRYAYIGEAYARLIGQMLEADLEVDVCNYGKLRFPLVPLPSVPAPYLVFNIHAGELSLERRWPLESFRAAITALLTRRPDLTAVLIGHGKAEASYAARLGPMDRVIDLCGKLSFEETVCVIANAELLVTNDTGPLHFGLATNTPTVGIFGPTRGFTYLPPGRANAVAVQEQIYCSPCVHHWEPPPCLGDNQCMKRLLPSRVIAQCEAQLGMTLSNRQEELPPPAGDYYAGLVYTRDAAARPTRR